MDWFKKIGQSNNKFYTYKKLVKNLEISRKTRTRPMYTSKVLNPISNRYDNFHIYPTNKCVDRIVINLENPEQIEWFETYIQCAGYKKGKTIVKKYLSNLGKLLITYQNEDFIKILLPIKYVENDDYYKEK